MHFFFLTTFLSQGVGAIYIRRRPRVRVEALQSGGGQERGMRSGTVPTPLVVGLGAACELAQQEMEVNTGESRILPHVPPHSLALPSSRVPT